MSHAAKMPQEPKPQKSKAPKPFRTADLGTNGCLTAVAIVVAIAILA